MNAVTSSSTAPRSRTTEKTLGAKASASRKTNGKAKVERKTPAPKTKSKSASTVKTKKPISAPAAATATVLAKKGPTKAKLIRDSFTLPEPDHELIKQCKKAAIASGRETKKSEVVRAAIRAFSELSIVQQLAAYDTLQAIAVGRPKAK